MKKYDGILLCSDYDMTLTSNRHVERAGEPWFAPIPKNNIEAVKYFVANGGAFACVSGRNPDEISRLREIMPLEDLCVASNGTAVYSIEKQRAVFSYTVGRIMEDVVRFLGERRDSFIYMRITDNDFKFHHCYENDDINAFLSFPKYPVYKMIVLHKSGEDCEVSYRACRERFGDKLKIDRSWADTLEICPLGSGKGEAIRKMLPVMNKKFDKIVCAGDNENDLSMIKFADVGYAVGNAVEALKEVADRITVESYEGAIAAIIEEL